MSRPVLLARCPAKINLSLRVLGKRRDGYHELDTVFQTIDLWDTLEVRPADAISLTCDDPRVPADGTNLVIRAARLFSEAMGCGQTGAAFHLRKKIPLEGGLGGGSSDAAGALLLCSRLWQRSPDRASLQTMAAALGADVPFFLTGGTARGRGRGDLIEPLPPAGPLQLLLGCPPFGIPTGEVFAGWVPTEAGPDSDEPRNGLQTVVFRRWPELEAFRDALLELGASSALLSGSGSTVYGRFPGESHLVRAAATLAARFERWRLIPTRSVREAAHIGR